MGASGKLCHRPSVWPLCSPWPGTGGPGCCPTRRRRGGRTGAAAAAAAGRCAERGGPAPSERQAPPPIALRLGRGAGAGRPRTHTEGARGGVRAPGPTCGRAPGSRPPAGGSAESPTAPARARCSRPKAAGEDAPPGPASGAARSILLGGPASCSSLGVRVAQHPSPAPAWGRLVRVARTGTLFEPFCCCCC